MKILVTGATGFIGRVAVAALRARGHALVLLDRIPPAGPDPDFHLGDVRDPVLVGALVRGCDAVLHLAAAHHDFGIAPETYHDVNVTATEQLTAAMTASGVRNIAFFSSAAVYGATGGVRTEATAPAPITPYGATKLQAELVLGEWAAADPAHAVLVIRPTVVFGPGNFANMYTLIRQIEHGRFAFVGPGTNRKSLAYVGNLVDTLLARWPEPGRPGVQTINYADHPDLSSREIAEAIYSALGVPRPRWSIPMPLARVAALPFDLLTAVTGRDVGLSSARLAKFAEAETRLASEVLAAEDHSPRVTLSDAIAEMVGWYLREGKAHPEQPRLPLRRAAIGS